MPKSCRISPLTLKYLLTFPIKNLFPGSLVWQLPREIPNSTQVLVFLLTLFCLGGMALMMARPSYAQSLADMEQRFYELDYKIKQWEALAAADTKVIVPPNFENEVNERNLLAAKIFTGKAEQAAKIADKENEKKGVFETLAGMVSYEQMQQASESYFTDKIKELETKKNRVKDWLDVTKATGKLRGLSEENKKKINDLVNRYDLRVKELKEKAENFQTARSTVEQFLNVADIYSTTSEGDFTGAAGKVLDIGKKAAEVKAKIMVMPVNKERFESAAQRIGLAKDLLEGGSKIVDGKYADGAIKVMDGFASFLADERKAVDDDEKTFGILVNSDFVDADLKKLAGEYEKRIYDRLAGNQVFKENFDRLASAKKAIQTYKEYRGKYDQIAGYIAQAQSIYTTPEGLSGTTDNLLRGMKLVAAGFDQIADVLPPGLNETLGEFLKYYAEALKSGDAIAAKLKKIFESRGYCVNVAGGLHQGTFVGKYLDDINACPVKCQEFLNTTLPIYEESGLLGGFKERSQYYLIPDPNQKPEILTPDQYLRVHRIVSDFTAYAAIFKTGYQLTTIDLMAIWKAVKEGRNEFSIDDNWLFADTVFQIDTLAEQVRILIRVRAAIGEELTPQNAKSYVEKWKKYEDDCNYAQKLCRLTLFDNDQAMNRIFVIYVKDEKAFRQWMAKRRITDPSSACRARLVIDGSPTTQAGQETPLTIVALNQGNNQPYPDGEALLKDAYVIWSGEGKVLGEGRRYTYMETLAGIYTVVASVTVTIDGAKWELTSEPFTIEVQGSAYKLSILGTDFGPAPATCTAGDKVVFKAKVDGPADVLLEPQLTWMIDGQEAGQGEQFALATAKDGDLTVTLQYSANINSARRVLALARHILKVRSSLIVTVVDATSKKNIVQAKVNLRGPEPSTTTITLETSASGQASFSGVTSGEYLLTVSATGYQEVSQKKKITGAKEETVYLKSGSGLVVTVADASSKKPIPQAKVNMVGPKPSSATISLETSAAGQATFPGISNGEYTLTAAAVGFKEVSQPKVINLTKEPKPSAALFLESVKNPVNLKVNISDAGTKKSIAGANVNISSPGTKGPPSKQVTDANGQAVFPKLSPGGYQIQVEASGYQAAVQEVTLDAAKGTEAKVDIALKPGPGGAGVRVVVIDAEKASEKVASAKVTLSGASTLKQAVNLSAAGGAVTFPEVPAGDYTIMAKATDYEESSQKLKVESPAPPEGYTVEIKLKPTKTQAKPVIIKLEGPTPTPVMVTDIFSVKPIIPPEIAPKVKYYFWEGGYIITPAPQGDKRLIAQPEFQYQDPKITLAVKDKDFNELGVGTLDIAIKKPGFGATAPANWKRLANKTGRPGLGLYRERRYPPVDIGGGQADADFDCSLFLEWDFSNRSVQAQSGWSSSRITIGDFSGELFQGPPTSESGETKLSHSQRFRGYARKGVHILTFSGGAQGEIYNARQDKIFWKKEIQAAYQEALAILKSLSIQPGDTLNTIPAAPPFQPLRVKLEVPRTKVRVNESVEVKAVVENAGREDEPLSFSWTGNYALSGDKRQVSFLSGQPGKQQLEVTVKGARETSGSASVEFDVQETKAELRQTGPFVNLQGKNILVTTIRVGGKADFEVKVDGDQKDLLYRWQPMKDIKWAKPEGPANSNTAQFLKPDTVKVWVEVLAPTGQTLNTVTVSNQLEIAVVKPQLKLIFDPDPTKATLMVGQEIKARLDIKPDSPDGRVRWLPLPANAQLLRESPDSREITFILKNDKPVKVEVMALVKDSGEELGRAEATVTAKKYEVTATVTGAKTDLNWPVWDEKAKGLVMVPKAYKTEQAISVKAGVKGYPRPENLRYAWQTSDGCLCSNTVSAEPSFSRRDLGSCECRVSVTDVNGAELGDAKADFSVTVSDEMIEKGKQESQDAELEKKVATELARAKELWNRGQIDEAIDGVKKAGDMAPAKLKTKVQDQLRDYQTKRTGLLKHLDEARQSLIKNDFVHTRQSLDAAAKLNPHYPPLKALEKELADRMAAFKKAEEAYKMLMAEAEALEKKDQLEEALKKYQEAYQIEPNPDLAEKMKQLKAEIERRKKAAAEPLSVTMEVAPKLTDSDGSWLVTSGQGVEIAAQVKNGQPPYKYSWAGSATGEGRLVRFLGQEPGAKELSVEVTDNTGTKASAKIIFKVQPLTLDLETAPVTGSPIFVKSTQPVEVKVKPKNGVQPYKFIWTGKKEGEGSAVRFLAGQAGTEDLSVEVVDKYGNKGTAKFSFKVEPFTLDLETTPEIGGPTVVKSTQQVEVKVKPKNGVQPYKFTWTGKKEGEGSAVRFLAGHAGTEDLSVEVADKYGNKGTAKFSFKVEPLTLDLETIPEIGGQTVVKSTQPVEVIVKPKNGVQPYKYTWKGKKEGEGSAVRFLASQAGTEDLSVEVADKYGNKGTAKFSFKVEPLTLDLETNPAVSGTTSLKSTQFVDIAVRPKNGQQPFKYVWKGEKTGEGSTVRFKGTKAGLQKLSVEVIDALGNKGSAEWPLDVQPLSLQVGISPKPVLLKPRESATLTVIVEGGQGPYQYGWQGPLVGGDRAQTVKFIATKAGQVSDIVVNVEDEYGNKGSDRLTVKVEPIVLDVTLSADKTTLKVGQATAVRAKIGNGQAPYQYQWRGDFRGQGDSVRFMGLAPGKRKLALVVKDGDGNQGARDIEFDVSRIEATIEGLQSPAILEDTRQIKLVSPDLGNYPRDQVKVTWMAEPGLVFNPASGSPTTTVIFDQSGSYKIWAELTLDSDGSKQLQVGRSRVYQVSVGEPQLILRFEPETALVGKTITVELVGPPGWDWSKFRVTWTGAREIGAGQASFQPPDLNPVDITATVLNARSQKVVKKLGQTYRAQGLKVDVAVDGPVGSAPTLWDKTKKELITVPTGMIAANQRVRLTASCPGKPQDYQVEYVWNPGNTGVLAAGQNTSRIEIYRREPGVCQVAVTVMRPGGGQVGSGSASFQVSISQEQLDQAQKLAKEEQAQRERAKAEQEERAKAEQANKEQAEKDRIKQQATGSQAKPSAEPEIEVWSKQQGQPSPKQPGDKNKLDGQYEGSFSGGATGQLEFEIKAGQVNGRMAGVYQGDSFNATFKGTINAAGQFRTSGGGEISGFKFTGNVNGASDGSTASGQWDAQNQWGHPKGTWSTKKVKGPVTTGKDQSGDKDPGFSGGRLTATLSMTSTYTGSGKTRQYNDTLVLNISKDYRVSGVINTAGNPYFMPSWPADVPIAISGRYNPVTSEINASIGGGKSMEKVKLKIQGSLIGRTSNGTDYRGTVEATQDTVWSDRSAHYKITGSWSGKFSK